MDLFTQNMINRTKQRQELLSKNKLPEFGAKAAAMSAINGSPGSSSLVEDRQGIIKESTPNRGSQKRKSFQEKEVGKENANDLMEGPVIFKPTIKNTILDSDVGKQFLDDKKKEHPQDLTAVGVNMMPEQKSRKNRLEALAYRINDWEDESVLANKQTASTPEKVSKSTASTTHKGKNSPSFTPKKSGWESKSFASRIHNSGNNQPQPGKKEESLPSPLTQQQIAPQNHHPADTETDMAVSPIKAVVLDKSVLHCLELQGFTPTASRSRLIFEFEKEQEEELAEETAKSWTYTTGSPKKSTPRISGKSPIIMPGPAKPGRSSPSVRFVDSTKCPDVSNASSSAAKSPMKPSTDSSLKISKPKQIISPAKRAYCVSETSHNEPAVSVLKRAAQFDSPRTAVKDPAELTLSERKALFEKNRAQPSIRKFTTRNAACPTFEPCRNSDTAVSPLPNPRSTGTPDKLPLLTPHVQPLSAYENARCAKDARMKELEELRSRHETQHRQSSKNADRQQISPEKPRETFQSPRRVEQQARCSPQPDLNASPKKKTVEDVLSPAQGSYAGLHQVKPIRVSPPKPGKLYPCLSDIEMATDNEPEEQDDDRSSNTDADVLSTSQDELDSSFTVEILGRAGLSQFINTPKKKLQEVHLNKNSLMQSIAEHSSATATSHGDDSDDNADISNLLDEAFDEPEEPNVPVGQQEDAIRKTGRALPLYHSVSTYRKQQQDQSLTPSRQVVRNPAVRQVTTSIEGATERRGCLEVPIQQQIRNLQEEINTQQNVMSQASQALNLCRSTAEFSGSTEQVEGERLLLVASQKKQAAMNEILRLKTEAAMKTGSGRMASRGILSISNLSLPLKKDFVTLLSKGGDDFLHYFVVLIRNRGQVIPLQMLSTADGVQDGTLCFPNLIQLRDLSTDFQVAIEVYALQTKKEKLNHEAKYHIRKDSSKLRLTPKKLNKQDNRISKTSVTNSIGSSSAVRSSSFGLVGFAIITPSSLRRRDWTLEKVPFASPIDGKLQLTIKCHCDNMIEERGFLTVFEDVAGFGAWHRRWCLLSNDRLLFWKYPDDEKRKEPLSQISLRKCVTANVEAVSHDVCARPNTFLLVTVRQPEEGDKNSLVMTTHPQYTALRHLISADLKEERILWCSQINQVLANLRAWDTDVVEPTSEGLLNAP